MTTYEDYRLRGDPEVITAFAAEYPDRIGPRVLDGVAYVHIRTSEPLIPPETVVSVGPELSSAVLGGFMPTPEE